MNTRLERRGPATYSAADGRRPMILRALLLALLPLGLASAIEIRNEVLGESEIERRFLDARREKAARFRLARERARPGLSQVYHRQAAGDLDRAIARLEAGELLAARRISRRSLRERPYSDSGAGHLHVMMRTYAAAADMQRTRRTLVDLWERYPDYEDVRLALEEALTAAEVMQGRGMRFNLQAQDPRTVIEITDNYLAREPRMVFSFIERHGDRHGLAPRASLGVARAILAEGKSDNDVLHQARFAYDDFFARYPSSPLVFRALCEQAMSYLVAYRGAKYDVGVLITAASIIDQAEIYTRELPERIALVRRYRGLVRGWHQERDLYAARWYRKEDRPEDARYYYREVVERDPGSPHAVEAEREMEALPPAEAEGLGPVEDDDAGD